MDNVDKLSRRYIIQATGIIVFLSAAIFAVKHIMALDGVLAPMIVSAAFSLVIEYTDALVWRTVAKRSQESLPTFYTAVSGFRMLLALVTMFVYWLIEGRETMLVFFLVFAVYYILLLGHHSVFFGGVSNSCDKTNSVK